jgi:hypothetical protein
MNVLLPLGGFPHKNLTQKEKKRMIFQSFFPQPQRPPQPFILLYSHYETIITNQVLNASKYKRENI